MSLLTLMSKNQPVGEPGPPTIYGQPFGGGFYAGRMTYEGLDYYLVVADKASETSLAWKTTASADAGPTHLADGLANTNSINDASHPAAQYCLSYTAGGFGGWYLPARDELELAYRNLKPSTTSNTVTTRDSNTGGGPPGINSNSNPVGSSYTGINPAQTLSPNFQFSVGSQAFDSTGSAYWTSTQGIGAAPNTSLAIARFMAQGTELAVDKTNPTGLVRPFRRVPVEG